MKIFNTLFTGDIIDILKNPKDYTFKLVKLISAFSIVLQTR